MLHFEFYGVEIAGIATAVPTREVLVDSFADKFGSDAVQKFKKVAGINKLHWAGKHQTASDLGYVAARELLQAKKVDPTTIDALIMVTQCPDYKVPATACVLHKRLGLPTDCIAFDVNLGCSGYVYGLQILCSCMQTSNIKRALLIVGDTSSKSISPQDRSAIMLFGDSGSATLLEKNEEASEIVGAFRTDGTGYRAIIVQAGAFRNPNGSSEPCVWGDGNIRSDYDLYMNGTDVFNFSISEVPALLNEFMAYQGTSPDNYDCLVLHQANLFILKQVAKRTGFSMDKVQISLDDFGNTSVTSIPLTLSKNYGQMGPGEEIRALMSGFGIGLSWGVVSTRIKTENILPIVFTDEFYTEGGIMRD